jgi:hypothetical protein
MEGLGLMLGINSLECRNARKFRETEFDEKWCEFLADFGHFFAGYF